MVYIHSSIQFSIFIEYLNTLAYLIFISCLFCVRFPVFNNGWMINFVNSTSCIFLKLNFKGIILIILVCIFEFIPNISTEINRLQGIFDRSNFGTADHYRITIKHINIIYALFESQGQILQGLVILI